jgi:hypothetical protein
MNWRRGLLLAGIHFAVAGTLLAWEESESWRYIRSEQLGASAAHLELAAFQEEDLTVTLNPCGDDGFVDGEMSPQERLSGMANLPVALLTGWHEPCTSPNFLDSVVERILSSVFKTRFHRTRASEVLILAILCTLVAVEWLFVGGFPLVRPGRWWLEPGAFIPICTLVGAALATIPYVAHLSLIPATMAGCAWLWWFGLLVWKTLEFGWKMTSGLRAHLSD